MDPITTAAPADPPEEILALLAMTHSRIAERDPSLRYLGTSAEAARALADLAGATRSTVWHLQRRVTFYALRHGRTLIEDARRRGVTSRLVVRSATLRVNPIFSSYEPKARVGPVPDALLILDSRDVVLPGRDGASIWTSSDPRLVAEAIKAFEAVWAVSLPAVPDGEDPPLTPRMVDIAWLLAAGASDRRISREIGISERTVSAEVRELGRRLGTNNRGHTIARICGSPL